MKLRAKIFVVLTALGSLGLVAPAANAGQVCYDLEVNLQGQAVVDEAGCVDTP